MSVSQARLPRLIEQQLLGLDKQIRDSAFVRGSGRFVLAVCLILGSSLLLDSVFGLNGALRGCLLAAWVFISFGLLWRGVIRPAFAPVSMSALAAVVEREHPELRERLTSLVELRGDEGSDLAPGASKLMQDLLARQTLKALGQVTFDRLGAQRSPMGAALVAAASVLLLLAPFAWNSDGYGLLWSRFFVPWGNFAWGATIVLNVVEGDQVVARDPMFPFTFRWHYEGIAEKSTKTRSA